MDISLKSFKPGISYWFTHDDTERIIFYVTEDRVFVWDVPKYPGEIGDMRLTSSFDQWKNVDGIRIKESE